MADDLHFKTLTELQSLLSSGDLSSVELTQALINRKEAVDPQVQAFNSLNSEGALAEAEAAEVEKLFAAKASGKPSV